MKYLVILLLTFSVLDAQLKTVSIEQLPLAKTEVWSNPRFSPSGKEIFLTNAEQNGIWQYSFETKLLKEITRDRHSGFNFSVSPDGDKVAYRRTNADGDYRTRVQESVVFDLKTNTQTSIHKGNSVHIPVFHDNDAITVEKFPVKNQFQSLTSTATVLGIESTKIILLLDGVKRMFDPLNGQYIWPTLSPDKKKIVAVEMDHGTFMCTVDGTELVRIGKLNAPHWERSGKWIIGMDDRDDGHSIVASDIVAKSTDGTTTVNLTSSIVEIAMYPSCSPIENKIVFNTYDGNVFVLMYEEVK